MTPDELRLLWQGLGALRWQNRHLAEQGALTVGDIAIERQYQDWCDREEAARNRGETDV